MQSELNKNINIDGYTLKDYLGAGQFGEVWLAHDTKGGNDVAIKFYVSLDERGRKEFFDEYKLASTLQQENLLRVSYLGEYSRRPYMVMDYCEKGPASNLVGTLAPKDEEVIWRFVHDVAAGLRHLHANNIVHQDIKPDNILQTSDGRFVIADFGISTNVRATMRKQSGRINNAGSVAYMPPEKFKSDSQIIKAGDLWALGVSIYELAVGKLPFAGQGGVMQLNGAEMPEIESKGYSNELNTVMQKCLQKETWDRFSAESLMEFPKVKELDEKIKAEEGNRPQLEEESKTISRDTIIKNVIDETAPDKTEDNPKPTKPKSKTPWILWVTLIIMFVCVVLKGINEKNSIAKVEEQRRIYDSIAKVEEQRRIYDSIDNANAERERNRLIEVRRQDSIKKYQRFVYVKAGTLSKYEVDRQTKYWSDNNGSYSRDIPIYKDVSLDGFYIGKYEITQKEFFEIMGYNPSAYKDGDDYPVHYCHFLDAVRYCNNRSKKDGFDGFYTIEGDNVSINLNGNGYRLPTREEWAFAAHGEKKNTKYAAGNNLQSISWYGGNSGGKPHEVGLKEPNFRGIYDLNGNVTEIVWYQFKKNRGFCDMGRDCNTYIGFDTQTWGCVEDNQLEFNGFRVVLIFRGNKNNNCSSRPTMYNVSKFL